VELDEIEPFSTLIKEVVGGTKEKSFGW